MKVWVCSSGSYSDQYDTAVYSNKEMAEIVSRAYGWNDPEEFELDGAPVPKEAREGLNYYSVTLAGDEPKWGYPFVDQISPPDCADFLRGWHDYGSMGGWRFMWAGWARDKVHALKIAADCMYQTPRGSIPKDPLSDKHKT